MEEYSVSAITHIYAMHYLSCILSTYMHVSFRQLSTSKMFETKPPHSGGVQFRLALVAFEEHQCLLTTGSLIPVESRKLACIAHLKNISKAYRLCIECKSFGFLRKFKGIAFGLTTISII